MLTTTGRLVNDGATILYQACKYDCTPCPMKPRCCPKQLVRKVPRSIYEGARDMARVIAASEVGRTSRRERKKVEMLFAHLTPTRADHPALAQSRRPMDMMIQGWSMRRFQASQQ